jgi:hypothetical protein
VDAKGAVALSAVTGLVVGQIESDKRVDLYSYNENGPQGRIVSAPATDAGIAHVTAPEVSVYGYGQSWSTAQAAEVLTVKAQALQVSAPTGVASRGMTTGGLVYRLMDQGVGYLQLKVVGNAPERVRVPVSQVQTELKVISDGDMPTQAWQLLSKMDLSAWVPSAAGNAQAVGNQADGKQAVGKQEVMSYLQRQPEPLMASAFTSFKADASDDLLSDMAYGLSTGDNTVVLSLELDAPLVRSTGQLLAESDWTLFPQ